MKDLCKRCQSPDRELYFNGNGLCQICWGQERKCDWAYDEFEADKKEMSIANFFIKLIDEAKKKYGSTPPENEPRKVFLNAVIRFIWAHYVAGSDPGWIALKLHELERMKKGLLKEFVDGLNSGNGPRGYINFCDILPFPDYSKKGLAETTSSHYPWIYFQISLDLYER